MHANDGTPGHDRVAYQVPEGQDPAAVMATLQRDGWTGTIDHVNSHELIITGRDGQPIDRDRVRVAIAAAPHTTQYEAGEQLRPEDVRFSDE